MDYRLEVIGIPVSDVDASKAFYSDVVGFAVDHDISPGTGMRVVQLTPLVRRARSSSARACRWASQERQKALS